jgi:hypothetical protein
MHYIESFLDRSINFTAKAPHGHILGVGVDAHVGDASAAVDAPAAASAVPITDVVFNAESKIGSLRAVGVRTTAIVPLQGTGHAQPTTQQVVLGFRAS